MRKQDQNANWSAPFCGSGYGAARSKTDDGRMNIAGRLDKTPNDSSTTTEEML
jgi:hypothetical protein